MQSLLAAGVGDSVFYIVVVIGLISGLVVAIVMASYLKIYLKALFSDAKVSFFELIGMSLRKVRAQFIVDSRISLVQAGITSVTSQELEAVFLVRREPQDLSLCVMALVTAHKARIPLDFAMLQTHHFAGGNVTNLVNALVGASRAKLNLDVDTARAIDLAGRDIIEAVNTSVNPRVIDCPGKESSSDKLDAVAKDGIRLLAKARVTVRTNISQLIGGATEETVIARVGQAIVSAIGSRDTYKDVLENPDHIAKSALAGGGLAAGTAFEILSVDIADISVAGVSNASNVGAQLQAEQAEADKRRFQAEAEKRRAMAIAQEAEMRARVEENRAKVVLAEAEVPLAMAEAFRNGNLGIMDYYRMKNIEADTGMRRSIGKEDKPSPGTTEG
ncbi:MAG: flotillin-like FloA family protein [Planctomycetes bacterium]|nr:flotillin-like FloA family protein [Planctomycetota bacterium]